MTPERRAELLLKELRIEAPPVDIWKVARKMRVRVERTDLGEECSGVLVRSGSSAVIGVHFAHHPHRQRFTVAHELGHFILHEGGTYVDRGTHVRFRNAISGSGTETEEREANQFAAALLMPRVWARQAFEKHPFDLGDDSAITELADQFGVSIQALSIRLTSLGILGDSESTPSATRRTREPRQKRQNR